MMEFWIACCILAASLVGILVLKKQMRGNRRKAWCVTGIVFLAVLAAAAACYLAMTAILVGAIG